MKILFVASVYRHLITFHIPYIKLLQSKGYSVWVAAGYESGKDKEKYKKELEELNVMCVDVSFQRRPLSTSNVKAFKQLKRLANNKYFDLVHVHTPVAAFLTRLAFKGSACKVLYTAHGFHFYKGASRLNWNVFYPVEKVAQSWTDGLIVMNEEDKKSAERLGYDRERVFYVHGVGVEMPEPNLNNKQEAEIREKLGLSEEQIVISFIAELNDNKNHHFLLRNWTEISKECPNAVLLIIGAGDLEQKLKFDAKDLPNVLFLGQRSDVPSLLSITHINTLLSKREGLPKSIMEAMANSIPCVGTDTRGIRDLIHNGESGFIVSHGDDERLQKAFTVLIQDDKLRRQMGSRSFELVQPFNLYNVVPEYEAIYDHFLKNGVSE